MPYDDHIKGKNKRELLSSLMSEGKPGTAAHEQVKSAIIVACTEDLEQSVKELRQSIDESSKSSNSLSKRVFWLNLALTLATIVGAAIACLSFFFPNQ